MLINLTKSIFLSSGETNDFHLLHKMWRAGHIVWKSSEHFKRRIADATGIVPNNIMLDICNSRISVLYIEQHARAMAFRSNDCCPHSDSVHYYMDALEQTN